MFDGTVSGQRVDAIVGKRRAHHGQIVELISRDTAGESGEFQ